MPEQLKTTTMHFYDTSGKYIAKKDNKYEDWLCGPNLIWDGCSEIQILGPQIVD